MSGLGKPDVLVEGVAARVVDGIERPVRADGASAALDAGLVATTAKGDATSSGAGTGIGPTGKLLAADDATLSQSHTLSVTHGVKRAALDGRREEG